MRGFKIQAAEAQSVKGIQQHVALCNQAAGDRHRYGGVEWALVGWQQEHDIFDNQPFALFTMRMRHSKL